jgi:succinyl-diaminopimelate desuccinylase
VDIRSIHGHRHAEIVRTLQGYLGAEARIGKIVDVGGVDTPPDHPWIQEVYALMGPILGEEIKPRGAPYFTDASALQPAYGKPPTVILGPGEMKMAHQTDEYCYVSRIEEAANVYETLARRWCGL